MWPRILNATITAACCCGAYWTLRAGFAAYAAADFDKSALERGIRWTPGNPDYYAALAEADPAGALAGIRKAAELNPYSSGVWMEYSRVAEARTDFSVAEACLLKAVHLDNTFAPRWLLSEYYYRRGDARRFWPAIQGALAKSYDDVSPLFQKCWELTSDPDAVLQVMPPRADVLSQYLDFLVNQKNRLDLAVTVAERLQGFPDPKITSSPLNLCDRLLQAGQAGEAVRIWNGLARARLVPPGQLPGEHGAALTNGKFLQPFLEHGFDWRMTAVDGVYERGASDGSLRFTFSGKQPEQCELLSQWVPLTAGHKYKFRVRYETDGLEGETGLAWRVLDAKGGADLLAGSGRLAASTGAEQGLVFAAPANSSLARLVLGYQRVLGSSRISGSVTLSQSSVEFAE